MYIMSTKQEFYTIAQEVIKTTDIERKQNAEVLTPLKLVNEMISKIPEDAWTDLSSALLPKIFDPCVGKGAFVVVVYDLLWEKLEDLIPDEEERSVTILEEMLYFADINPFNIHVTKMILDPTNKYKLNYNEGNTLELDIKEKWDIDGFDIIIGNPPYNARGGTGTGNTIWQHFVKKYIKKTRYLCFVHPSGWRKPNTKRGKFYGLYKLMTQENQMIYLSIHGIKDGKKTFNCGTRYDWYLIHHKPKYTTTIVNDEKNNNMVIDMSNFDWLPNYNIDTILSILAKENEEKCHILCDFSYSRLDKKIVSKDKTNIFKYPLIYLTPLKGIRYMYSCVNNKGHFKIPKVIIGETGMDNAINDYKGEYGMTQDSFGIIINNKIEGNNILKAIKSEKFKNLIKNSCSWSNFRIDWKLFTYFKKDFWKEFI